VAEYKNMVGRAGRLGFATEGTAYTLAVTGSDEHYIWSHYVSGSPEDIESRFVTAGDPRSLILRVLASAQRSAHEGVNLGDIVDFLEGSFGAYRHQQTAGVSPWTRDQLLGALADLRQHALVEEGDNEQYHLTSLGRFAGESGVEVESIICLVEALQPLSAEQITDPTLLAATQVTVELDEIFFPINRRSTQKEPQAWSSVLRGQGVAAGVLNVLSRRVNDKHGATIRAKKAVACLLWITDKPIGEIERTLTQFGGAFGGVSGPLRASAARTRDLLPTVVKVAQTLHPDVDFTERCSRLLTRLEIGVAAGAADLAQFAGAQLSRVDYHQLLRSGLCSLAGLEAAMDEDILRGVDGDEEKLAILHVAIGVWRRHESEKHELSGIPKYEP
jgi:hypothetical protein